MSSNCTSLTWSSPVDHADISPTITFPGSKLQFFLYVSHNYSLPSIDDCIVVSFYRVLPVCAQECQVLCTISMVVTQTGQKTRNQSSILYFAQDKNVPDDEGVYLITRKCLFNSGLVLDGKITICCEVTVLDHKKDIMTLKGFTPYWTKKKALDQYESLLDSCEMSDITFVIGERQFKLHKAILFAQSPVFAAMFRQHSDTMMENENNKTNNDNNQKNGNRVELVDIGVKVFETIVRFIYTGKVDSIDETNLMELFVAADKFQLLSLKFICAKSMTTKLTIESVASVLLFADTHGACALKSKCIQYIHRNATQVMVTKGWKQLVRDNNSVHLLHELYRDIATKVTTKSF